MAGRSASSGNCVPLVSILNQSIHSLDVVIGILQNGNLLTAEELIRIEDIATRTRTIVNIQAGATRPNNISTLYEYSSVTTAQLSDAASDAGAFSEPNGEVGPLENVNVVEDTEPPNIDPVQISPEVDEDSGSGVLCNIGMSANELLLACYQTPIDDFPRNFSLLEGFLGPRDTPDNIFERQVDIAESIEQIEEQFMGGENSHRPTTLISGLLDTLGINTSLFSSEVLAQTNPDEVVEMRTQYYQPTAINKLRNGRESWDFHSDASKFTTILAQARLQMAEIKRRQQEDGVKKRKQKRGGRKGRTRLVRFATNIGLESDIWVVQSAELDKLPDFLRCSSRSNLLNYLGYTISGINSPQLFMKLESSRTPIHVENGNLPSININMGPSSTYFYNIPYKHLDKLRSHCEKKKFDLYRQSLWPITKNLIDEGIDVETTVQDKNDVIYISPGSAHYVENRAVGNNVAYNILHLEYWQYLAFIESHEHNRKINFRSLVPCIHLSWEVAEKVEVRERNIYQLIRTVLKNSLVHYIRVLQLAERERVRIQYVDHQDGSERFCEKCKIEVYGIFLSKLIYEESSAKRRRLTESKLAAKTKTKFCIECAASLVRTGGEWEEFTCIKRKELDDLTRRYDQFVLRE